MDTVSLAAESASSTRFTATDSLHSMLSANDKRAAVLPIMLRDGFRAAMPALRTHATHAAAVGNGLCTVTWACRAVIFTRILTGPFAIQHLGNATVARLVLHAQAQDIRLQSCHCTDCLIYTVGYSKICLTKLLICSCSHCSVKGLEAKLYRQTILS